MCIKHVDIVVKKHDFLFLGKTRLEQNPDRSDANMMRIDSIDPCRKNSDNGGGMVMCAMCCKKCG